MKEGCTVSPEVRPAIHFSQDLGFYEVFMDINNMDMDINMIFRL